MTQKLYFVTTEDTSNRAKASEIVNRLGMAEAYAGGFFLWSDRAVPALQSDVAGIGAGTVCVIPVDVNQLVSAGILSSKIQTFLNHNYKAA